MADDQLEVEEELPAEPLETAPVPEESGTPAEPVQAGQPREPSGRYAPKAADAPPVLEPGQTPEATPEPIFVPFRVKVDKEEVGVDGVEMTTADGHTVLMVPEDKAGRLQQVIGRGIMAEKNQTRDMDRARQLQAWQEKLTQEQNAPKPPSDAEIEAKTIIDLLRPKLPEMLSAEEIAWLTDKVELAKLKAHQEFRTTSETAKSQATEGQDIDKFQSGQLAGWIDQLSKDPAYLGVIGQEEKEEIFDLIFPNKAQWFQVMNGQEKAHYSQRFAFHDVRLKQMFDLVAKRIKTGQSAIQKVQDADKFNKRQNAPSNAPPAPGKKVTPQEPKKKTRAPGEKLDKDAFLRGDYDGYFPGQ